MTTEVQKQEKAPETAAAASTPAPAAAATQPVKASEVSSPRRATGRRNDNFQRGQRGGRGRSDGRRGGRRPQRAQDHEFDQRVIDIARVTRVMAGGKRMSFRACVVIGDGKGRVGFGVKKGKDVSQAIQKAVNEAKKNMLTVLMVDETIPHPVNVKFGAAKVMLRPAEKGRGILAGGPVRAVLELAGVKNVVTKMRGSQNKINNIKATFRGLSSLRTKDEVRRLLKPQSVRSQDKG